MLKSVDFRGSFDERSLHRGLAYAKAGKVIKVAIVERTRWYIGMCIFMECHRHRNTQNPYTRVVVYFSVRFTF